MVHWNWFVQLSINDVLYLTALNHAIGPHELYAITCEVFDYLIASESKTKHYRIVSQSAENLQRLSYLPPFRLKIDRGSRNVNRRVHRHFVVLTSSTSSTSSFPFTFSSVAILRTFLFEQPLFCSPSHINFASSSPCVLSISLGLSPRIFIHAFWKAFPLLFDNRTPLSDIWPSVHWTSVTHLIAVGASLFASEWFLVCLGSEQNKSLASSSPAVSKEYVCLESWEASSRIAWCVYCALRLSSRICTDSSLVSGDGARRKASPSPNMEWFLDLSEKLLILWYEMKEGLEVFTFELRFGRLWSCCVVITGVRECEEGWELHWNCGLELRVWISSIAQIEANLAGPRPTMSDGCGDLSCRMRGELGVEWYT